MRSVCVIHVHIVSVPLLRVLSSCVIEAGPLPCPYYNLGEGEKKSRAVSLFQNRGNLKYAHSTSSYSPLVRAGTCGFQGGWEMYPLSGLGLCLIASKVGVGVLEVRGRREKWFPGTFRGIYHVHLMSPFRNDFVHVERNSCEIKTVLPVIQLL